MRTRNQREKQGDAQDTGGVQQRDPIVVKKGIHHPVKGDDRRFRVAL
jgi:hypothetical protein